MRKFTIAFLFILLFYSINYSQQNYYIDSQYGDDSNDGLTESTAWKSHTKVNGLALLPGDVVSFKRGSQFSGPIEITHSGTEGNPILFTSYGTGELPRFTNPKGWEMEGNCIRISADWIIVEKLHFHDTPPIYTRNHLEGLFVMGAIVNMIGSDHNIIRHNTFKNCTKGIQSTGEYTLISHNYLDGPNHALWWDEGSPHGFGPMGIQIGIGNHEIAYNTIKNYVTWTSPYGYGDGGAIEMDDGRFHKKNVYIHHNYSIGNCGFFESSWWLDWNPGVQEVYNLRIAFNVSFDYSHSLLFWAPCHDTYVDNNTFIRTRYGYTTVFIDFYNDIDFRNNLFVYSADVYDKGYTQGTNLSNNWYLYYHDWNHWHWSTNQAGSGNPDLVDLNGGNYHLNATSPLRGKGINLSEFYENPTDFDGNTLPSSGSWDVGAYSYEENRHQVPGTINAEEYSMASGVIIENRPTEGDGYSIGYIDAGDWMVYNINVPSSGRYKVEYNIASLNSGGIIQLEKAGGSPVFGTINVPKTDKGWYDWQTISHEVELEAGDQDIGINAVVGGFNLNWIKITPACAETEIMPYLSINGGDMQNTTSATLYVGNSVCLSPEAGIDGTWNWKGPNGFSASAKEITLSNIQVDQAGSYTVLYTNSNGCESSKTFNIKVQGSIFIEAEYFSYMNGVQTEQCYDINVGQNVGWLDAGDWMVWDIDVPIAGTYDVEYRVASELGGGRIQPEEAGGGNVYGIVDVPATGGYQNWITTEPHSVTLSEGAQQIAIFVPAGGYNLNWIQLTYNGEGFKTATALTNIETIENIELSVFPNPVMNRLNVKGVNNNAQLKVYTMSGKKVIETTGNNVDVSYLCRGVYVVLISCDGQLYQQKFTKE